MNWRLLTRLFNQGHCIEGITLEALPYYDKVTQPLYRVQEQVGDYKFDMLRLQVSKRKITYFDDLGLVGLASVNMEANHCFLTEGVSDFMSLKLMRMITNPDDCNVLGVTKLGGDTNARRLLLTLFDNYTIMADDDVTGLRNAASFRQWLVQNGKTVKLTKPMAGCKDISAEFLRTVEDYYPDYKR